MRLASPGENRGIEIHGPSGQAADFPAVASPGISANQEGAGGIGAPEFLPAIIRGKFHALYLYRPKQLHDFRGYVERFYEQKQRAERDGDKAGRLIAKILINAGYGKLAQRPKRWREYLITSHKDVIPLINNEGWREEMVDPDAGFAVWSKPSDKPARYYNVAAAASITGYVRARLIESIHRHHPLYCDTDSMILQGTMPTGEKLGDWSLEVEGDMLLCAGKKLYGLRVLPKYAPTKADALKKGYQWYKGRAWKIASKGCRLTPLELAKVCSGKIVKYHNQAPTFSFSSGTKFISRDIRMTV